MKQVALITGVAGGIGSATARAFADAGWHVVGVEVREVDAVPAFGHLIHGDISDPVASQ